jgi:hypothetical protein
MKKNAPKKLTLSKETVRALEEPSLMNAAGGLTRPISGTNCNDSFCICA